MKLFSKSLKSEVSFTSVAAGMPEIIVLKLDASIEKKTNEDEIEDIIVYSSNCSKSKGWEHDRKKKVTKTALYIFNFLEVVG